MFCNICGKEIMNGVTCLYCGHVHAQNEIAMSDIDKVPRGDEVSTETVAMIIDRFIANGKSKAVVNKYAIASMIIFFMSLIIAILVPVAFILYIFCSTGIALAVIGLVEARNSDMGSDIALIGLVLNSLLSFIFLFIN